MFPLLGSVALLSLYLALKYLDPAIFNRILSVYFGLIGVVALWRASIAATRKFFRSWWARVTRYQLLLKGGDDATYIDISFRLVSAMFGVLSIALSTLYSQQSPKSALLNNILALSFVYNGMIMFKLDGFKTGCILLTGLFFYDIWWVFGTEVMVKVATTLDAPIKLLWPKSLNFSSTSGYALLGLGDIILPGSFISLCLRYDHHLSEKHPLERTASPKSNIIVPFPIPYFKTALLSYVIGLATTITVMHTFGQAQPALLYLSPACILAFVATAWRRGEWKEAWGYTESNEEDDKRHD